MSQLSEIKVGAVVIAALIILGIVTYFIMGPGRLGKTYPLDITFKNAQGLSGGEPVRMSGVEMGRVKEVTLTVTNKALVRIVIRSDVVLYDNYTFTISSGALVPEKFVDVQRGPTQAHLNPLKPGVTIQGQESAGLQEILSVAHDMLSQLEETASSINSLLGDPQMVKAIRESVANMRVASKEAAAMLENLHATTTEASPDLCAAVKQIASASEEAQKAVSFLSARLQTSPAPADVEAAAKSANEALQSVRDTALSMQKFLTDPALQGDVRTTIANFQDMSGNLKEAAKNIRVVSEDVKSASPHIKSITERADALMGNASKLGDILKPPQIEPQFDFLITPHNRSITDANFDLSLPGGGKSLLRFGVSDIGEANEVNVQAGRRYRAYNLRYGLVRSKLGFGADMKFANKGSVSLDVSDPNAVRADLLIEYPMGRAENGLGIVFGIRDGFRENTRFVGVRLGK